MQDKKIIELVNKLQDEDTKKLTEIFHKEAITFVETGDFTVLLKVERVIKEILLTNGIYLTQFRDISEDCDFLESESFIKNGILITNKHNEPETN